MPAKKEAAAVVPTTAVLVPYHSTITFHLFTHFALRVFVICVFLKLHAECPKRLYRNRTPRGGRNLSPQQQLAVTGCNLLSLLLCL